MSDSINNSKSPILEDKIKPIKYTAKSPEELPFTDDLNKIYLSLSKTNKTYFDNLKLFKEKKEFLMFIKENPDKQLLVPKSPEAPLPVRARKLEGPGPNQPRSPEGPPPPSKYKNAPKDQPVAPPIRFIPGPRTPEGLPPQRNPDARTPEGTPPFSPVDVGEYYPPEYITKGELPPKSYDFEVERDIDEIIE